MGHAPPVWQAWTCPAERSLGYQGSREHGSCDLGLVKVECVRRALFGGLSGRREWGWIQLQILDEQRLVEVILPPLIVLCKNGRVHHSR